MSRSCGIITCTPPSGGARRPSRGGQELKIISQEESGLDLSGLISQGARSRSMHYQMWFTEEHPDMCSLGPTRNWLEYAAELISQNFETCNVMNLDTAGFMLQHCGTHAVRNFIVDERSRLGWLDTKIRVYPFLDAIICLSATKEEGAWPRGRMVVVEPSQLDLVRFICRFPANEQPKLADTKHVRKLLQAVEDSGRVLVSDGSTVLGIAIGPMPGAYLAAQFSGTHGFLWIKDDLVCSFADGRFHSSNLRAKLVQLEEQLLESDMDMESQHQLMQIVSLMVNRVRDRKHGCTLVIDTGTEQLSMSGQHFEEPLDLQESSQLKLACSLAKLGRRTPPLPGPAPARVRLPHGRPQRAGREPGTRRALQLRPALHRRARGHRRGWWCPPTGRSPSSRTAWS